MADTIFIQVAAYRDPELIPTIKDCIAKASNPDRLHFCIGWQFAPEDNIDVDSLQKLSRNITILKVSCKETKGACWIRRKIQDCYNKETYTLQLDSHHRFVEGWDTKAIKMLKGLKKQGYKKPLLTSYLPSYDPINDPTQRVQDVWQINYDRFLPEGPIFFRPSTMKGWKEKESPVPARGISAHFIFTLGRWCKEVRYDPELYFHGEEISLAVRSYTHGYDLFHPHRILVWHQYTRANTKKHWDDNTDWGTLNSKSYHRVKVLLGIDNEDSNIDFKECGLGTKRSLHEFERYAGVVFKNRRFHKDVLKEELPPVVYVDEESFQKELVTRFKHCIDIYRPEVPEPDYDFWCVVFKDENGHDLYRKDADENEIRNIMKTLPDDKFIHIWREFDSDIKPYKWTVWPHSKTKEWKTKIIESVINYK